MGLIDWGLNRLSQINQNKYNRQQSEIEWQKNLQLTAYQNWYNSPKQQIQRLKEAGLNPNLAYGSGEASVGNMSDTPSYNATASAPMPSSNLDILGSYNRIRQTDSSVKLQAEQTEGQRLKNLTELLTQAGIATDNAMKAIDADIKGETKNFAIDNARLLNEKIRKELSNIESETGLNLQKIKNLQKEAKLTDSQTAKVAQEIENMKKDGRIKDFEAKIKLFEADYAGERNARLQQKLEQEIKNLVKDEEIKDLMPEILKAGVVMGGFSSIFNLIK